VGTSLKRFYEFVCRVEAGIAAVFLITAVVVIFAQAVFRTFDVPIHWALDTALLVFAWGVFLGADVAFREDKLVSVDFVLIRMPPKLQKATELFLYALIGVFLISLVYFGVDLSISTRFRAFQGIPWLSYTWVTASIPTSALLMLIALGIKVRRALANGTPNERRGLGSER
jgi:TRAP-type C4-dicarboxylate transport system permease small subunit